MANIELRVNLTIDDNRLDDGDMKDITINGKDVLLNYSCYNRLIDMVSAAEGRKSQLAEQLDQLHAIDSDKLGEYQCKQQRLIGSLEAYERTNYVLIEEDIEEINGIITTLENISNKTVAYGQPKGQLDYPKEKEMANIEIFNKTSETIEVLKNDEVMLIDGWLRVQTYEGMIVEMNYTAVPAVESYVYFWHDYLPRIAKATKLHEWDIQYNLWVDSIENDFKLAIV